MILLFWLVALLVAYAFVGFPLTIVVLGGLLRRSVTRGPIEPRVTVLIAAYNEAAGIRAKIRNTLDQHYPAGALDVVVVDDASADGTAEVVAAMAEPRVRLLRMTERGGKIAALNRGIEACTGDIVLYTDANAEFAPDAVRRLVMPFADPDVGGVCGNQRNRPGRGALALGERLYWEYDKFLKRMETRTGSIVAADGSIYALRRAFVEPVPPGVTDDFFLSTSVVAAGKRLVFEAAATSEETPLEHSGDHLRRRIRITEQALESLRRRRALLNPFRSGLYAFVLAGHKLLRRLAAPLMLLLFPLSFLVRDAGGLPEIVWWGQAAFYLAAAVGWVLRGRALPRVVAAPLYVVLGVLGTTIGILRFASGQRSLMWEPVRH